MLAVIVDIDGLLHHLLILPLDLRLHIANLRLQLVNCIVSHNDLSLQPSSIFTLHIHSLSTRSVAIVRLAEHPAFVIFAFAFALGVGHLMKGPLFPFTFVFFVRFFPEIVIHARLLHFQIILTIVSFVNFMIDCVLGYVVLGLLEAITCKIEKVCLLLLLLLLVSKGIIQLVSRAYRSLEILITVMIIVIASSIVSKLKKVFGRCRITSMFSINMNAFFFFRDFVFATVGEIAPKGRRLVRFIARLSARVQFKRLLRDVVL